MVVPQFLYREQLSGGNGFTLMFEVLLALACHEKNGLPQQEHMSTVPRKSCFVRIDRPSTLFETRCERVCAQLHTLSVQQGLRLGRQKVPLETCCPRSLSLTTVRCCRRLIKIPGMFNIAMERI